MPSRPEWWPEGEPWPSRRRGFRWWMFLPPLLLIGVCSSLAFGQTERRFWFPWFLIPLFFVVLAFGRRRRPGFFPVRSLIGATKKLSEGDYTVRVSGAEGGPMREVVVAFNEMARRLEASSTQRKQLLADLGHELRTPLTVLQGEIEAMIDGVHQPVPEQLERLLEETTVISRLLDDLRTLSLSEAGELRLEREEVDLGGLLAEAADSFRRRAEIAGVALMVAATPVVSQVDPVRIREVVSNLLSNGLRQAPRGTVVRLVGEPTTDSYRVSITDEGPGIPAEILPRVFDRFVKGSDSTGTGLGLSIARDLVRAHGGELVATNLPHGGTELSFSIPTYEPPGDRGESRRE